MGKAFLFSKQGPSAHGERDSSLVVLRNFSYPLHVEGYADTALVAPDSDAAAAYIFSVDFEVENHRKRHVTLQDEP